jgi:tetratricopeptide (TPR) repeat protein
VLEELEKMLLVENLSRQVAIVGLGGIGKTQTALEFAYRVKAGWPDYSIFWIPAVSMESMEQACGEIARILEIPRVADAKEDVKELVKQHLSRDATGKWLLIVDNADNMNLVLGSEQLSHGIADYLPQSENGLVLFTTRYQEVAVSLSGGDIIELEEMNEQEAVGFLTNSLARKHLLEDDAITMELLGELAYLPLALAQAAAYLNRNKNTSIADYLRLLRNTEQDMLGLLLQHFRDSTRYKDSENAVAKTWLVSFDQIRDQDEVAANLLSFISCIESKSIPRSILPPAQPEERMTRAIGTLCGYSFLSRRGKEEIYDMHRLVHLASRVWVEKHGTAEETVKKVIQHVSTVFPYAEYENRLIWRGFLTHTLRLLGRQLGEGVEERYELCLKVGRSLFHEGRFGNSVKWFEESFRWRKDNLAEEHPDRLLSQHELAGAYRADGQIEKAVELLEYVVAVRIRILGEEHPHRLASQHELATAYQADGQIKKAVELLEHVVAVRTRILAKDDPSRLASQNELAGAYQADGRIKKAVELLEHVVGVEARILAEEHPDRLTSQSELAGAYQADGQIKKAVELLEHVVGVEARIIAEEHPDRLVSQHELARAYQADGQIKKAVKLLEHVVVIHTRILAEEHPHRLASQHELAIAYQADGQIEKAVKLMEHVVALKSTVLREDHPSRLRSERELEYLHELLTDLDLSVSPYGVSLD